MNGAQEVAAGTITVTGLTIVSPAGVALLQDTGFSVGPGEVLMIIGPSGSGKTTLIRLLCGLLAGRSGGWQVSGVLRHRGRRVELAHGGGGLGGLVFQNHALFDDLTAAENLCIVADHAQAGAFDLAVAGRSMLADIAPSQSVSSCSGGQRQRLAIARTLLSDPALLLLDEPNSGLDIRASRRLAELIQALCRETGKPAIIVAHHVDEFMALADRILLIDPAARALREVAVNRPAVEAAVLALEPRAPPAGDAQADGARWSENLPRRPRAYWFLRYLGEYLWLLFAAPSMLLYVVLGSSIVGFVTVWFGFNYHSFGGYLRAILHDETLEGLGFVLATVAVPFNTCLLIVARNSAIIAADLGNRVSGMQMQAMRNLGLPGRAYIVASIMISLALGSLLLVAAGMVSAFATSLITWHFLFPGQPTGYWQENFFRKITEPHVLATEGGWVVLKVVASAVLGGGAAVLVGLRSSRSPSEVSGLIATAIISGVSLTLLVHAVLLILQF